MATTLQLKLVTPSKVVLETEVDQATFNTEAGEITILPLHTELATLLRPGILVAKTGKDTFPIAIAGGVAEMRGNTLLILADSAEHASEIDLEQAEKAARELAQKLKTETTMDVTTYKLLLRQLEQEQARINASKKWRK